MAKEVKCKACNGKGYLPACPTCGRIRPCKECCESGCHIVVDEGECRVCSMKYTTDKDNINMINEYGMCISCFVDAIVNFIEENSNKRGIMTHILRRANEQ
jgi:hypothetical protein